MTAFSPQVVGLTQRIDRFTANAGSNAGGAISATRNATTGYPLVLRPSEKSKAALIFTPTGGPGMAGAAATLRF